MRIFISIVAILLIATACTIDKTDYKSEIDTLTPDYYEFKEVISFTKENYTIRIEAMNGHLYKGYNEVRLKIVNTTTKQMIEDSTVTFLPIKTSAQGKKETCPNQYNLVFQNKDKFYQGYSVFTDESTQADWKVEISFVDNKRTIVAEHKIAVEKQVNKNLSMTSFTGNDKQEYIIALKAPLKAKVAENDLVVGIYTLNPAIGLLAENAIALQEYYEVVTNYTLLLDPRMPEPSMGNHSSPNNKDLLQKEDQFYHGVVNYTMTGNWTLNFMLLNQYGRIVKGTKVPTDFTPGVEGIKSELHIDILF